MKQIPNHPNYEITTDGRIWSKKNCKWLRPTLTGCGHYRVRLGSSRLYYVHRLVLETFVGPCPANKEGCHKNDIGTDNRLSHLRWDTRSNNRKDAVKNGVAGGLFCPGEKHPKAILSKEDVHMIIYIYQTRVLTQKEIAKLYNISRATVAAIVNKNIWKHLWRTKV